MTVLWWARRDLRLRDNPALCAAAADGPVVPLVVIDPALFGDGARPRDAWYAASVLALDEQLDGGLHLRTGTPADAVLDAAREAGATAVHVSRETTPFGRRRDAAVRSRLAEHGIDWVETGSPYAVTPGRVTKADGSPYRVFGAFQRAWHEHRWPAPARPGTPLRWAAPAGAAEPVRRSLREAVDACTVPLPPAGEDAAARAWDRFRADDLPRYADDRDRPDLDTSSRLSPYLKVGAVHPRTLLADLRDTGGEGAAKFVSELCWREFYADVLHHHPRSLRHDLTDALAGLEYDAPGDDFAAWQRGETGFPLVDAGMRQLRAEGWMHNRVRMVVASFLGKDLHHWWPHGAAHFLDLLIDGDPASNAHGWQWVSGTGTDAAPYFRVFNPTAQAEKFDPRGDYVRRYVPELRHLDGSAALHPWKHPDGYAHGYPTRIVDHAQEREETLLRYRRARGK
ncbi:cryptochrome/photolyase family protein [Tsukamurella strandjordii]|uniref:Deoxyribodipyrimidine photo-lyase n=1 Tax=Tsukamurella strandjordii TaxID=147577 RepID=A0AA90S8S5_9ACTN|nr:deoxyribodipyrimidine photo-lyase [Tsukamurella strandjordii]MDP0399245.1 deoxyribodipyrimidine photo-lyase [Tsukamurella strandjordii]